ncbi:3-deoxy-D-manno-octulosonic acid transferase [Pseudoalteromonas sp. T1lg75]|uniref:3-deoxy-D-manno-octulosonic acid transferase n=1 Tax=Pseudoalteromonas sp. T1lg75 TaxID=2077102 RepID=UPI002D7A0546|nr:glycosyltransferase [Pseudoalteromonas sp. T1lg75]
MRKSYPDALLIIAPRHPEQFDKVAEQLTAQGMNFSRRSKGEHQGEAVLLADTLGELTMLYGAADVAFIGGSLIERGGHNPLEACAHGIPVLSGQHTFNFDHVYPALINEGGALWVDEHNLVDTLNSLFSEPQKRADMGASGLKVVQQNQGAINKTLALIEEQINA